MNQKFAKFARTLFIVLMILFILFSIPMLAVSFFAFLFTASCALGCYLIARKIKKKYIPANRISVKEQPITNLYSQPKKQIPDGEMNYNLFEDFVDKNILVYEYEENIFLNDNAVSILQGKGGAKITFVSEPENPYDSSAVLILLDGQKIGYVYRGKVQDMINDWLKRNDYFIGYINKYSIENNKATYKIGFYKPLSIYENKRFPLTKVTKRPDEFTHYSRYEKLCECEDGDFVLIEQNYEDNYIVTTEFADEIGELPKSAIAFIESEDTLKRIVGTLDGCNSNNGYDDESNLKPYVTVYLIK